MKNSDLVQQTKAEILQRLNVAITSGNEEEFTQAYTDLANNIQEAVMDEAKGIIQAADTSVLVGRGVRQLTSEENNY